MTLAKPALRLRVDVHGQSFLAAIGLRHASNRDITAGLHFPRGCFDVFVARGVIGELDLHLGAIARLTREDAALDTANGCAHASRGWSRLRLLHHALGKNRLS